MAATRNLGLKLMGVWLIVSGLVQFTATASDPEDGIPQVRWFADGSIFLGAGTNVVLPTYGLSFGPHTITAVAIDSGGQSVPDADGGITLNLVNTPPVVSISKPTSGGVFYIYRNYRQGGWTGDTIDLVGTSSDANNLPAALPTVTATTWSRSTASSTCRGSSRWPSATRSTTASICTPTTWGCLR